jgi:hypothetical protein
LPRSRRATRVSVARAPAPPRRGSRGPRPRRRGSPVHANVARLPASAPRGRNRSRWQVDVDRRISPGFQCPTTTPACGHKVASDSQSQPMSSWTPVDQGRGDDPRGARSSATRAAAAVQRGRRVGRDARRHGRRLRDPRDRAQTDALPPVLHAGQRIGCGARGARLRPTSDRDPQPHVEATPHRVLRSGLQEARPRPRRGAAAPADTRLVDEYSGFLERVARVGCLVEGVRLRESWRRLRTWQKWAHVLSVILLIGILGGSGKEEDEPSDRAAQAGGDRTQAVAATTPAPDAVKVTARFRLSGIRTASSGRPAQAAALQVFRE